MGDAPDLLFVGTGRLVAALDRFTGRPVWLRKLPRLFSGGLITLMSDGQEVYVGRGGYVYCLDRTTGEVLWERGVGSSGSTVMLALAGSGTGEQQAASARAAQHAAATSAAAVAGAVTAAAAAS